MPGPNVPFPPMEAEQVRSLPDGEGWQFEPKWDGFRGVLENDGGELSLWSRNERPLLRYFPELRPLGELLPPHSALDGEIVIVRDGRLDFDAMQMRLHPAESRVRRLAGEIPATYVAFDVLLWNGEGVHRRPLEERRAFLEERVTGVVRSPMSLERADAERWLDELDAAGLDGAIAKRLALPYLPGSREGVVKIKRRRDADCVVVGVRWKDDGTTVATLLLGLYDESGELHYVGSAASSARAGIEARIGPLLGPSPVRGEPGEPSRWRPKGLPWSSVRPELVVEVQYDKWQEERFRHGTRLLRFREDKDPAQCTIDQVKPKLDPSAEGIGKLLT
jgi:ATP-dependent DNA ligase